MSRLLRPLTRASTYRRAVFLLLGSVILLPYVLLVVLLMFRPTGILGEKLGKARV